MPAHTFERVGEYHEAGVANARAVEAFGAYLSSDPDAAHKSYLGHDCVFGVDAFMMSGEHDAALRLAQMCAAHGADRGLVRLVAFRFRDWAILKPDENGLFVTGMLAAHDHDDGKASDVSKKLDAEDSDTAKIAAAEISAAIDADRGDRGAQLASLKKAVSLQDGEGYSEPPRFWFPTRETLGAAQLRASDARDAAQTFRADLEKNPNNARSLYGLAAALDRLGDDAGAADARARFQAQWTHADAPLTIDDL